jgi:glycosyltransferase involved in cell wall biosynthesis
MKPQRLSFVIPVYNEERNVRELYYSIKKVLAPLIDKKVKDYEVIFVNDGSTDRTLDELTSLKNTEKSIVIIDFRKNFGKSEAYKAGFAVSKGDLIFTLDGDLQDNPDDIPKFLDKISEGYDIVIGWKYNRKDPITKTFPSKIFNKILRKSTGLRLHDIDNGFRCMKKEVITYLDLYEGQYRYIPVFANLKGFKVSEVPVNHRPRIHGKSKYGFSRLFTGLFDLMTINFLIVYIRRPLHFFGSIGVSLFSVGFLIALYETFIKLVLRKQIGEPMLILSVMLILIGIQMILFGFIGEMIANISRKESNYSIKKIY